MREGGWSEGRRVEPQAEAPDPGIPRPAATRRGSNSAGLPTAGAAAGPALEGGPQGLLHESCWNPFSLISIFLPSLDCLNLRRWGLNHLPVFSGITPRSDGRMTAGVGGTSLTAQASLGGLGHIQRGLCPVNLVLPESGTLAHKPAPLSLPVSVTGSTSAMVNF